MRNICNLFKYNYTLYNLYCKKLSVKGIPFIQHGRLFSQTVARNSFFEGDKRGAEYPVFPLDKKHWTEHIRDGAKIFVEECKLFREEVKEHFRNDPRIYKDGDMEVVFRFDEKVGCVVFLLLK